MIQTYGQLPGTPGDATGGRVVVTEAATNTPVLYRGEVGWVPPDGTVLVFGTSIGLVHKDGVYVELEASSEDLLVAAARALEPVP